MAPLPRRQVLRSGAALALPLALDGVLPLPAMAETRAPAAPLSGAVLGWVSVAGGGATLRLVHRDGADADRVLGPPLPLGEAGSAAGICAEAHGAMLRAVAGAWGVEPARCTTEGDRLSCGRRSLHYSFWFDWI